MEFFGELLIFVLLFITNFRVFFLRSAKRDPIVALAPLTFILSIFQILACGIDLFTALGFVIAFLVLLSNFHAIFRYSERLYVDHYSILMTIWAVFTSLLSLGAIVCLFIFAPKDFKDKELNIVVKEEKYTGTFRSGFEPRGIFSHVSSILYEFSKNNENNDLKDDFSEEKKENQVSSKENVIKNIVLFVPDKRGDTDSYKPFLKLLASQGYTVCSGDFFLKESKWFNPFLDTRSFRRVTFLLESISKGENFKVNNDLYKYNISQECNALLEMLKNKYGKDCRIFVISDVMSKDAVKAFAEKNPENVVGSFCLSTIANYKTKGYGCIAQVSPFINTVLGLPAEKEFETPKLLVNECKKHIKF